MRALLCQFVCQCEVIQWCSQALTGYIIKCYRDFTVLSTQDSLLNQQDGLWTPASLWNFEFSQSTLCYLNQQSEKKLSHSHKKKGGGGERQLTDLWWDDDEVWK